jgi:hypothetical protein
MAFIIRPHQTPVRRYRLEVRPLVMAYGYRWLRQQGMAYNHSLR